MFELDAVHFLFVIANSFTSCGVIRGDFHAFFAKLSNFPDRCTKATTKTREYLADISQRGFSTNKNKYHHWTNVCVKESFSTISRYWGSNTMALDGQPDTDVNRPRSDLLDLWLSYRVRRVWKEIQERWIGWHVNVGERYTSEVISISLLSACLLNREISYVLDIYNFFYF